ncbi:MAG TPA: cupredoxin family copper-binding protein [Acidimicrobiales bacterium]|nr:cupredoxin family copper-binding protein [Acidimicrobiales bacterium]
MRKRTLGVMLLTALLPLGACGDDEDTQSDSAVDPTSTTTETGAGSGESGGIRVTIKGFAFAPDRITVRVGSVVSWRNDDSAPHTVTADDGSFDSGSKSMGQAFEHTFTKAGEVTYKCTIHPTMKGTVLVSG